MRFGIIGDPVEHSMSPAIHNAGFAALGIDAVFEFVPTPVDRFADAERLLRDGTFDGASITMPHKGNAFAAVDVIDPLAERARAVNTIIARDGVLTGYNTDIEGVRFATEQIGLPTGTPVLLLGYGGAAAAALVSTPRGTPITISGRRTGAAARLANEIDVQAAVVAWGEPVAGAIVVNATPLGMHGESLPEAVVTEAAGLFDMTYGDAPTDAIATAAALGIPYADGLDMLVGQAVSAFELFTGRAAPTNVLRTAARIRHR
ncbi:MAG: shikimate dehydrogenase [Actinomycetia bacterium]|nr:shikimate dehydrogenase [Actinomycetes bacterium]